MKQRKRKWLYSSMADKFGYLDQHGINNRKNEKTREIKGKDLLISKARYTIR